MSHRSILRAPISAPFMSDNRNNPGWENWTRMVDHTVIEIKTVDVVYNPAVVPANSTSAQIVTVPGVSSSDFVLVRKSTNTSKLIVNPVCLVTSQDTVSVFFANLGTPSINLPAETYTFLIIKV